VWQFLCLRLSYQRMRYPIGLRRGTFLGTNLLLLSPYRKTSKYVVTHCTDIDAVARLVLNMLKTFHGSCEQLYGENVAPSVQPSLAVKRQNFLPLSPRCRTLSSDYLQSIDPRNSSDTKRNACYFSLQYTVTTMTTVFFSRLQ